MSIFNGVMQDQKVLGVREVEISNNHNVIPYNNYGLHEYNKLFQVSEGP